ncbi:MAG: serine hydroxymethyltransferase, partial [Candidatus Latescibacteria bacterium]|nr:serine hydroxymethyltransferase [Candidatus Latescibacterota bacterium]
EVLRPAFRKYAARIVENAQALASELAAKGFKLVSGGTDNHLMLIDFIGTGITGRMVENALGKVGITVNKNSIPFDPEKPTVTSGIRIGTPALTTRGMGTGEMRIIASMIRRTVDSMDNDETLAKLRGETLELTSSFPMFSWDGE